MSANSKSKKRKSVTNVEEDFVIKVPDEGYICKQNETRHVGDNIYKE
jgi:hypothetical protein